jgi:toxin CcdB
MAQFDVFENPDGKTNQAIPYLLDIQTNLLDALATRVVVPLVEASAMGKAVSHLHPGFIIENVRVFMSTAELAGISLRSLGKRSARLRINARRSLPLLIFSSPASDGRPAGCAEYRRRPWVCGKRQRRLKKFPIPEHPAKQLHRDDFNAVFGLAGSGLQA